MENILYQC